MGLKSSASIGSSNAPSHRSRSKSAIWFGLISTGLGISILAAYRLESPFLLYEGQYWATSSGLILISSVLCCAGILTLVLRRYSIIALLCAIFLSLILGIAIQNLEGDNTVDRVSEIFFNYSQAEGDKVAAAFLYQVDPERLKSFWEDVADEFWAKRGLMPPSADYDKITEIRHANPGLINLVFTDFPPMNNLNGAAMPFARNIVTAYAKFLLEFEIQKDRTGNPPSGRTLFDPIANDLDREVKFLCEFMPGSTYSAVGPYAVEDDTLLWLANRDPNPEVKQYLLELHGQITSSSKP